MEEELIFKSAEMLNEVYEKINNGVALTDYENGIYKTLTWIIESECDDDYKPQLV